MDDLARYAREFIGSALATVTAEAAADAYVVSLFVYDDEDDPDKPTVMVGFNTESAVADNINSASSESEARWNFAFWLQNDLGVLCDTSADPKGAALRDTWVAGIGLTADDEGYPSHVTQQFLAMLKGVVMSLHRDGVVATVFGRPIPVLVHELEYYEKSPSRTRAQIPTVSPTSSPNGFSATALRAALTKPTPAKAKDSGGPVVRVGDRLPGERRHACGLEGRCRRQSSWFSAKLWSATWVTSLEVTTNEGGQQ